MSSDYMRRVRISDRRTPQWRVLGAYARVLDRRGWATFGVMTAQWSE